MSLYLSSLNTLMEEQPWNLDTREKPLEKVLIKFMIGKQKSKHFSASFVTITKYSNKSSLPKEFSEYDSSRFHYAVVAGLREDYNEATYRDRRNKVTQQNILTLHYDNLYDKACELETAQSF